MRVSELINFLNTLTGDGERNMDMDVLIRINLGKETKVASTITFVIEDAPGFDETLFVDVDRDEYGERLGQPPGADTIPAPPPMRHLRVVK